MPRQDPLPWSLPFAPYRLSGTVYGTALNDGRQRQAMAEVARDAPYKGLPEAPVLYLKPRNAWCLPGEAVVLPRGVDAVEAGANLGLIIGRAACRVRETDFEEVIAGCVLIDDLSVPHASLYRPSVPLKAWDGSLVVGPAAPLPELPAPDRLVMTVRVDGVEVQRTRPGDRVRSAARLLADVTDFMTLSPGDVLMLGTAFEPPRVRAGQTVEIEAAGIGMLRHRVAARDAVDAGGVR